MQSISRTLGVRFALLSMALGASIVACASDGATAPVGMGADLTSDELGGQPPPGLGDPPLEGLGESPPPKRPPLCKVQADCEERCPPGSKGCACQPLPDGKSVCVPTCGADSDCPALPGGPPLSCKAGVCVPPPPPPRPAACQSETDCAGKCPPGAKSCSCREAPVAHKVCVPTCTNDDDCPSPPAGPALSCKDGVCAPPPPPPPPTR